MQSGIPLNKEALHRQDCKQVEMDDSMSETLPFQYWAYGLQIQSALRFPELVPYAKEHMASEDSVVRVGLGKVPELQDNVQGEGGFFYATSNAVIFSRADVGRFLVRNGHEIIIDPVADAEES